MDTRYVEAANRLIHNIGRTSEIGVLRFVHMRSFIAPLPPGAIVLSAGCGLGLAELALSLLNPGLRWLALDHDPSRFAMAQAIAADVEHGSIEFIQADLNGTLELPVKQLDAIVISEVLMYLEDPSKLVAALSSVLKPTGQILIVEPFVDDATDVGQRDRLRVHTQSRHGGFTHDELARFSASLKIESQFNCYSARVVDKLSHLRKLMLDADDWHLNDLLFDLAESDLRFGIAYSRQQAVAVGIICSAQAACLTRRPRRPTGSQQQANPCSAVIL